MAGADPGAVSTLSEYEQQRQRNMATNQLEMTALGIQSLVEKKSKQPVQPRQKRPRQEPTREPSRRAKSLPVPTYRGQDEVLAESSRQIEIEQGSRTPDGLWSGERFGGAPGVAEGDCFGKGDYQRLGRQEMSASGFHQPFVNPEWCAPGVGCYSLILNNDNGASTDKGDTILYAGSGGRRRGQNRTAPQSFDQEWENVTNAALLLNYETRQPVRVVRGPKLRGAHGTAGSGGGYRYDGLYAVAAAEMVMARTGLRTAMFKLTKI